MGLQELLDIAARHATTMADAMVAACLTKAVATGEAIDVTRLAGAPSRGERPSEDVPWRRMVERNTDTRLCHV